MESIILAIAKREGVTNLSFLAQKSGFKRDEIRRVLNILTQRGKITFLSDFNRRTCNFLCNSCHLNKICMIGGNKKWN